MAAAPPANPPLTPQYPLYDNQDTFSPDISELYSGFITPIDQVRSHFNALIPGSQQVVSSAYQESRCHAFFRMLGLPVVAPSGKYYSPGYDPNLNLDYDAQTSNTQIANDVVSNNDFITSQRIRETQIQPIYSSVFSNGGVNATAVSLGSMHIRSYANQFTPGLKPLDLDEGQIQDISARLQDIQSFFGASSSTFTAQLPIINLDLLTSTHIIKPFVVDPRIDNSIRPNANRIAAPFLLDRSQLKIFDPQSTTSVILKRPYIEFVLSTIFNNANAQQLAASTYITSVVNAITVSDPTNQALLNTISTSALTQTGISVFSKYLKMIRSMVSLLFESQKEVEAVRTTINWKPIPSTSLGPEAGAIGAILPDPVPGDPNNNPNNNNAEVSILNAQVQQIMQEFQLNVGTNGLPDPGDFAFSGVDDLVFDAKKAAKTSYADMLQDLTNRRTQVSNNGMNALKNIEVIVGEFGGLGLLDIFAIQAAMWVVPSATLASMMDAAAFARMKQRQDLSVSIGQSSDIIGTLTTFEAVVVSMYKLIDAYIQDLIKNGQYTDIQPQ